MLALEHDRFLVIAVTLVTTKEFGKMIIIFCSIIILDADICRSRTKNSTGLLGYNTNTRVNSSLGLHTSSNNRSFCCKKRNGLTLHV